MPEEPRRRKQGEAEARADVAGKVDELFMAASGFSTRQRVEGLQILSLDVDEGTELLRARTTSSGRATGVR